MKKLLCILLYLNSIILLSGCDLNIRLEEDIVEITKGDFLVHYDKSQWGIPLYKIHGITDSGKQKKSLYLPNDEFYDFAISESMLDKYYNLWNSDYLEYIYFPSNGKVTTHGSKHSLELVLIDVCQIFSKDKFPSLKYVVIDNYYVLNENCSYDDTLYLVPHDEICHDVCPYDLSSVRISRVSFFDLKDTEQWRRYTISIDELNEYTQLPPPPQRSSYFDKDENKRIDYIFLGWYTEEDLVNKFDFFGNESKTGTNINLYAKWKKIVSEG